MAIAAVSVTTINLQGTDPTSVGLRRVVQDLQTVEKALNNLISLANKTVDPSDTVPPHVLATTSGLDVDHTVSGLTAGQVLKAIGATNAAFANLTFGELEGSDITDDPEDGDFIQFVDGFWIASTAPPGGSTGLNLGAGAGVYANNAGAVLQFKGLLHAAGLLIDATVNSLTFSIDPIPATALLIPFSTLLQGVVPPPGAINGFFLRDDGTWAAIVQLAPPPIGGTWETSDGTTALALPIGAITRQLNGTYTIKSVSILTLGGPGSCVVNIYKANKSVHYPPVSGDDITGGAPPSITSGTVYLNTTLTGWTLSVVAGDVFLFTLASTATFAAVQIVIEIG